MEEEEFHGSGGFENVFCLDSMPKKHSRELVGVAFNERVGGCTHCTGGRFGVWDLSWKSPKLRFKDRRSEEKMGDCSLMLSQISEEMKPGGKNMHSRVMTELFPKHRRRWRGRSWRVRMGEPNGTSKSKRLEKRPVKEMNLC